jgi:hypothetical protein
MATPAAWKLESFLDSLILELDKAQDTLAVKGLTRKLTYTVKDLALDLHIFPVLDGDELKFQMARPGDNGSSRISFQLGSITDRQIRETANDPITKDEVTIDVLDEVDPQVKASLKKVGVHSTRDLERLETRNVNLEKLVKEKAGEDAPFDYGQLANVINKARRRKLSPELSLAQGRPTPEGTELVLRGRNFILPGTEDTRFPVALVNGEPADVLHADFGEMRLRVPADSLRPGENQVALALDPYAVVNLTLRVGGPPS